MMAAISDSVFMGAMKATGSKDADVLLNAVEKCLALARTKISAVTLMKVAGILMCVTIIMSVIGIPLLIIVYLIRRGPRTEIANGHRCYTEYCVSQGITPSAVKN